MEQARDAVVIPKYESGYISLIFPEKKGEKYPYPVRVPVEMRAFQMDKAPIVFLIHILDGYLDELEIFSADGAIINSDTIMLDNLEYVIDPRVSL